MASDIGIKAKEAFIDDHLGLALDLYSQAIAMEPNNAKLFADRAQANIKLKNFPEAVADATRAIELDPKMPEAYFHKGAACIKLEEYGTAKVAVQAGASLAPADSRFLNLIKECDQHIAEQNVEFPKQSPDQTPTCAAVPTPSELTDETVGPSKDALSVVSPPKPKYRHAFYQKPEEVVVTVFAKGVPADSVSVDYGEQILSVTIYIPGEEAYKFQPRLYGKIVPAKCKYEVLSTKIEIRLAKAEPIQWTSLEFWEETSVTQRINVSSGTKRPTYPSSKPRTRDWDKIEAEVKKEEREEKLDGDAALKKFFRDIYQKADDGTRRALCKSFVESNGTVLSTNWEEVSSKKVEGSPPDGMELKKWEY